MGWRPLPLRWRCVAARGSGDAVGLLRVGGVACGLRGVALGLGGLFGRGRAGDLADHELRHAGVELQPGKIPGKATGCPVVRGDVVLMRPAGGGGYGDPLARDPERVHEDVRLGFVTARGAADAYGVVFAPDGAVDAAATAALLDGKPSATTSGVSWPRRTREMRDVNPPVNGPMTDWKQLVVVRVPGAVHASAT